MKHGEEAEQLPSWGAPWVNLSRPVLAQTLMVKLDGEQWLPSPPGLSLPFQPNIVVPVLLAGSCHHSGAGSAACADLLCTGEGERFPRVEFPAR